MGNTNDFNFITRSHLMNFKKPENEKKEKEKKDELIIVGSVASFDNKKYEEMIINSNIELDSKTSLNSCEHSRRHRKIRRRRMCTHKLSYNHNENQTNRKLSFNVSMFK